MYALKLSKPLLELDDDDDDCPALLEDADDDDDDDCPALLEDELNLVLVDELDEDRPRPELDDDGGVLVLDGRGTLLSLDDEPTNTDDAGGRGRDEDEDDDSANAVDELVGAERPVADDEDDELAREGFALIPRLLLLWLLLLVKKMLKFAPHCSAAKTAAATAMVTITTPVTIAIVRTVRGAVGFGSSAAAVAVRLVFLLLVRRRLCRTNGVDAYNTSVNMTNEVHVYGAYACLI